MNTRRGFTLVEILASIAVVAVLSVLLITATSKIINRARDVKCQEKLRQLHIASRNFYIENNNDQLAHHEGKVWTRQLVPYLETKTDGLQLIEPFRCPAAPDRPDALYWQPDYAINAHTALYYPMVWPTGNKKFGFEESPEKSINFLDWIPGWLWARRSEFTMATEERHDEVFRHGGRINVIFMDGHLDTLTAPFPTNPLEAPWR